VTAGNFLLFTGFQFLLPTVSPYTADLGAGKTAIGLSDLLLAALSYGIAFGIIQPALQAWAISLAAPERREAANAMFYSAFDLGIGTGAALCGLVAASTGYRTMYRGLVSVFALFLVLGALGPRPRLTGGPDLPQTSPREHVQRRQ